MKKINLLSKHLIKIYFICILSFLISFLSGFLITTMINNQNSYYQASFTYQGEKDLLQLVDKEYLESIKQSSIDKYSSINIDKLIDNQDFKIEKENNYYTITTKSHYYSNFFFISKREVGTRAKTFIKLVVTNYIEDPELVTFDNEDDIVEMKNYFSPYIGGCYALLLGVFLSVILISYLKKEEDIEIEDNVNLFHTPFHLNYWKGQLKIFKDTKSISTLAMLFSLLLVSKFFSLPSGFGNLGIGLGYLFLAAIGLIYGPSVSLIIGFFSDIIGYFITPQQGIFYLGYTLQACLASFTYGMCFYKTKITFSKVFLSRFIVNLLLNVILGSYLQCRLWMMSNSITSDTFLATFKAYALLYSLPKNLIYLLPQTIVLFIFFKLIIPIITHFNLIDKRIKNSITII